MQLGACGARRGKMGAGLAVLREWFMDSDAEAWDRQLEADVEAGKLEALAERALQDHRAGRSTRL